MKKNGKATVIKRAVDLSAWCKKRGGDMFVTWSPHVDLLNLYVFFNGWDSECENYYENKKGE